MRPLKRAQGIGTKMVVGEDTIIRNIAVAALLFFPEITGCNEFKCKRDIYVSY